MLAVSSGDVELAADRLWGLGAIAIEERARVADDTASSQSGAEGPITLIAGFADDDAALAARSVMSERWPCRFELPPDEAEWRDVWLQHLHPVEVGPLTIHPPWHPSEAAASPTSTVAISIDPGRAFGSGHHPSTQLAIVAMHQVLAPGDAVLDVGCGTGVLAIAALALGAGSALGIDLDHDIIEVARANGDANDLGEHLELATTPIEAVDPGFGLVVANITSRSLAPLIPDIIRTADSSIVVSGLLIDQQSYLENEFSWLAAQQWNDGEWAALYFDIQDRVR